MTLSEAQTRLAAIESAMARGERTVQFADRATTYRSMDELLAARSFFAGEVARLAGRVRQSVAYSSKGL